MNTKKSKSKNKSKPIQVEENNIILNENQDTNLKTSNPAEDNIGVSDNNTTEDVPKKPKRTKGKKKQNILVEDNKITEKESAPKHQELSIQNIEDSEELIKEAQIVHKKKSKTKHPSAQFKTDGINLCAPVEESCIKEVLSVPIIEVDSNESTNVTTTKEISSQKKKKKKKNRHDSEKSDQNSQASCTLAFQKLIQSSDHDEISDSEKINEVTESEKNTEAVSNISSNIIVENNSEQSSKDVINSEVLKPKKKNKKGKKHPPIEHPEAEIENKESHPTKDEHEDKNLNDNTSFIEVSPKPKAKIIKPVESKRKVKRNLQELKNESVSDPSTECVILDYKRKDTTLQTKDKDIIEANIDDNIKIDKELKDQDISFKNSSGSNFKDGNEISDLTQTCEQFTSEELKSDFSDFETVTGKSAKNKKKKNKNIQESSINKPENIKDIQQNLEIQNDPDVIKSKRNDIEIVPDFIDYPRSLSQLVVDNNNNTIIQEINTPEEVKLDIPICNPTPVIQGSGESPEVQIVKENINITEIDLKTPNKVSPTEKTDIKSKMIEVNRDMEELRRSIERSLAELTNTEKTENEIEKEFEEIFQSQCQESTEVEVAVGEIKTAIVDNNLSALKIECVENVDEPHNMSKSCPLEEKNVASEVSESKDASQNSKFNIQIVAPVCPARKEKGKGKSKKKAIQSNSSTQTSTPNTSTSGTGAVAKSSDTKEQKSKKEEKSNQKSDDTERKDKAKKRTAEENDGSDFQDKKRSLTLDLNYEPIEKFEDALTSSADDVNQTFDLIANDTSTIPGTSIYQNNPEINIIAPTEYTEVEEKEKQKEKKKQKERPVSQPKNLLGPTNIPVQSNKCDYKKEKLKKPDCIQAKVKVKDSVDIKKESKERAETRRDKTGELLDKNNQNKPFLHTNEDLVYKYNFRKVFLQSVCNVCQKELKQRIPCPFCSLVFYCSSKHKDENWPQHQPLCFAVSTIAHLKDQKHIYADLKNITGQEYRILRMQIILSCEKILKRNLLAWEQEALLYPRICADVCCREWRQEKLTDCVNCGQVSYCSDHPEHLPSSHQRWCKSYALYQKLVLHHQTFGKLMPKLPKKVFENWQIPDNMNEVIGSMYDEKLDISDIQYATLTQIATAPLTTMFCYQLFIKRHLSLTNGLKKKSSFTIHSLGNDLQSEADSLNKWETFFLHLLSEAKELRVVLIDPDLNHSKLPLELLGKVKFIMRRLSNEQSSSAV
ncbi:ankyrin repeat domain-containing protein 12 isoform X2 [Danaus plexippus]|uniref:ankyrin repeat domain-containing protein 12 isoform X2 n=1 Tax=Danaus plexippus TaxID=13037 RepID=UPI002AB163DE|nr:ankyrin repeat domain-containing protein 12 isoform X2 [Danaus plexippus]